MPRFAQLERKIPFESLPGFILLWMFPLHLIFFLNIFLPADVRAFETRLMTEFQYLNSSSTSTNKASGNVTESDFSRFKQLYRLDLSRTIYPYLTVSGGGLFASDSTGTSESLDAISTEQTIRPYIEVILNNPLYSAGVSFRNTEIKNEITDLPTTKKFKEDVNVNLRYRPAGLPTLNVFYNRAHNFDDPRTADNVDQLTTIKTAYSVRKKYPVTYTYVRNESENRLNGTTLLLEAHSGNASYSRSFLNDRLSLHTSYRIKHRTRTIPGNATVEVPLLLFEGLFSQDNTPGDGPSLSTVTALIDGNVSASSGINIGWISDGEVDRNIGIDFGLARSVDKIFVYVDRNIPSNAANSFSWTVYTSPDNTDTSTWTLRATVLTASFGVFQNRFEISFPEVDTRFIKVVTSPLPATFIGNTDLENIFITEVEAFITTVSTDEEKLDTVEHNFGFALTNKPDNKTTIGYNFFYTQRTADPSIEVLTFSNSIFANYIFNKVFSVHSRMTHNDSEKTSEFSTNKQTSYSYAASLRAHYMETFQQTLNYSSSSDKVETGRTEANSIVLRNIVKLYRGWDAFLDVGYGWTKPLEGGRFTSISMKAGTVIKPNKKITFNVNYAASRATTENGETSTSTEQSFNFSSLYLPYKTLSLFLRFTLESDGEEEDIFKNYSVNWAPFPDGDLQFFAMYSETRRRPDDQRETVIGPGLRWKLTRNASLNMSYAFATVETVVVKTETQSFITNLKMHF